jgi:hypothetical protein
LKAVEAAGSSGGGRKLWRRSEALKGRSEALKGRSKAPEAAQHETRDSRKLWRRSKAVEVVGSSGGGRELWRQW